MQCAQITVTERHISQPIKSNLELLSMGVSFSFSFHTDVVKNGKRDVDKR